MADFTLVSLMALASAVAFSSLISSATGMAGGIIMFAAMGLYFPLSTLIPIHGAVQLFSNAARTLILKAHTRWRMCLPFAAGASIGAAAAAVVLVELVGPFFPLLIILLLIVYTLFKPKHIPALVVSDGNFFWVGMVTGGMGVLVGAIDSILAIFFFREDLSKEEIVCNKSLMQLLVHLTKIPAFFYLGFSYLDNATLIAVLTCASIVGTWLGVLLLNRMSHRVFLNLMRAALVLAAVRITYQLAEIGVQHA